MPENIIVIAQYTLLVTGILVAKGGVIGFIKAKSKASLVSGVVSGILLIGCFIAAIQFDPKIGLSAGAVLLAILEAIFTVRFKKTKKFMPSGMLLIVCGISQVLVILGALKAFGVV